MKILELFCGTKSISNAFEKAGWETYTVDWDKRFSPELQIDVELLTKDMIIQLCGGIPDVIWASPDCTTYSIAGISHHRKYINGELSPISDYAKKCDLVNIHVINLIKELKPKAYFIENPRGGFRKMQFVQELPRYTITYCQYGDNRMKPTDIFTNYPSPHFKPICHNGDPCHISAPRGSRTGTQGLKGHIERSRIPDQFCEYIVKLCNNL